MIESLFNEIVKDARNSEIIVSDYDELDGPYDQIVRVGFNLVENGLLDDNLPNFHIKDKKTFICKLNEYVYLSLEKYKLAKTFANMKRVIINLLANITESEMIDLNKFLDKYVNFINNDELFDNAYSTDYISEQIGLITGYSNIQTYHQETPYSFNSYFEKEIDGKEARFYLPQISYGLENGVCHIYAIQNKNETKNNYSEYNSLVKDELRKINSGVNKFRNVTPAFIVALTFFLSVLEQRGINQILVVTSLPLREQNRKLINQYKIKFQTMQGHLTEIELERFRQDLEDRRIMIDHNVTSKFKNCFSRLQVHFDGLFLNGLILNNEILYTIKNMKTEQPMLTKMVVKSQWPLKK